MAIYLSVIRINTVLVRYGLSVRTKQYTKNPNGKYEVKAEISMKAISFKDSAKCSAFSAGWRPNDAEKRLFMKSREHGDTNKH